MAIPLLQMYKVARYIAGRKLRGDKLIPLSEIKARQPGERMSGESEHGLRA